MRVFHVFSNMDKFAMTRVHFTQIPLIYLEWFNHELKVNLSDAYDVTESEPFLRVNQCCSLRGLHWSLPLSNRNLLCLAPLVLLLLQY